ncbi:listerin E3 ubiquitin protein ligase 1 [Binucleata daphniae]
MNPFSDFESNSNFNLFNILSRFSKKSNITKYKALQEFEDSIDSYNIADNATDIKEALQPFYKQEDNDLKIKACNIFIKIYKKNIVVFGKLVPTIIIILLENGKETSSSHSNSSNKDSNNKSASDVHILANMYRDFLNEITNYKNEILDAIEYKKSKTAYYKIILIFTKNNIESVKIDSKVINDINLYNFDDITDLLFINKFLMNKKENKNIVDTFLVKIKAVSNRICINKKWEIITNINDAYEQQIFINDYKLLNETNMSKIIRKVYNEKENDNNDSIFMHSINDLDQYFGTLTLKSKSVILTLLECAKDTQKVAYNLLHLKTTDVKYLTFNIFMFCNEFDKINTDCDFDRINAIAKYVEDNKEWKSFDKHKILDNLNEKQKIIRCSLLNIKLDINIEFSSIKDIFNDALNVLPKKYFISTDSGDIKPQIQSEITNEMKRNFYMKYPECIKKTNLLHFHDSLECIFNDVTDNEVQEDIQNHIQVFYSQNKLKQIYNTNKIPEYLIECFYVNLQNETNFDNAKLSSYKMLNKYFTKKIIANAIKKGNIDKHEFVCEAYKVIFDTEICKSIVFEDSYYNLNSYFYNFSTFYPVNNKLYDYFTEIVEILENMNVVEVTKVVINKKYDCDKVTDMLSVCREDGSVFNNLKAFLCYLVYEILNIKYEISNNFVITDGLLFCLSTANTNTLYFIFAVLTKMLKKCLIKFEKLQEFYYVVKRKNAYFLLEYYEKEDSSSENDNKDSMEDAHKHGGQDSSEDDKDSINLQVAQQNHLDISQDDYNITIQYFKEYKKLYFDLENNRKIDFTRVDLSNQRTLNLIIKNIQKINKTITFHNKENEIFFFSNFNKNYENFEIKIDEKFMSYLDNESTANILAVLIENYIEMKREEEMNVDENNSIYGKYNKVYKGSYAHMYSFYSHILMFCENDFIWNDMSLYYKNRETIVNKNIDSIYGAISDSIINNYNLTRFESNANEEEIFRVLVDVVDFYDNYNKECNEFFWNVFLQSINKIRNIEILFLLERNLKNIDLLRLRQIKQVEILSLFIYNFPNVDEHLNGYVKQNEASDSKISNEISNKISNNIRNNMIYRIGNTNAINKDNNSTVDIRYNASEILECLCDLIVQESKKKINGLKSELVKTGDIFILKVVHVFEDNEFVVRIEIDPKNINNTKFITNLYKNEMISKKIESLLRRSRKYMDILSIWKVNVEKKLEGTKECYICYYILDDNDKSFPNFKCSNCSNKFHKKCLGRWLEKRNEKSCPLCRKKV